MKRILLSLMMVCLVFTGIPSFAEQPWPIKAKVITTSTANISELGAGVEIYGIKCIATANNAYATIHDSTTLQGCSTTNVIDEAGAASQSESVFHPLPEPIKVVNGSSVWLSNCRAIVYYRP